MNDLTTLSDADLKAMSVDELKQLLVNIFKMTVQSFIAMARVVKEIEDKGGDFSDIRIAMIDYLRMIAHGQILPELVIEFCGKEWLLQKMTGLPIPDQRKLLEGQIEIVEPTEDGYAGRLRDVKTLKIADISQAIGANHLRNKAEQINYLETRRPRSFPKAKDDITVDSKRQEITINKSPLRLTLNQLTNLISRLTD